MEVVAVVMVVILAVVLFSVALGTYLANRDQR